MNSELELKQRINKLENTNHDNLLPRLLELEKLNKNEKHVKENRSENESSNIGTLCSVIVTLVVVIPLAVAVFFLISILVNLVYKLFKSTGLLPF